MAGSAVELEIKDAISRIRFAPRTSHLLISSWDSVLRLYDVDAAEIRLEVSSGAPLLDCCFLDESVALSAGVDCCIRRYDLPSGKQDTVGIHGDVATSIEYSEETGQLVSTGLDKKLIFWDIHAMNRKSGCLEMDSEVTSMSLCGHYIIVAIGTHANVYDLRNLKGPLQTQGSSMDYSICCVRSLSRKQGTTEYALPFCSLLESENTICNNKILKQYPCLVIGPRVDEEDSLVVHKAL